MPGDLTPRNAAHARERERALKDFTTALADPDRFEIVHREPAPACSSERTRFADRCPRERGCLGGSQSPFDERGQGVGRRSRPGGSNERWAPRPTRSLHGTDRLRPSSGGGRTCGPPADTSTRCERERQPEREPLRRGRPDRAFPAPSRPPEAPTVRRGDRDRADARGERARRTQESRRRPGPSWERAPGPVSAGDPAHPPDARGRDPQGDTVGMQAHPVRKP